VAGAILAAMSEALPSQRMNNILFAILAIVIVVFIWFWITDPRRNVGEMSGTIEAITVQPSTNGHVGSDRTAMIRLADGTLVQASVVTPMHVRSGQRAKVLVSEQMLSGTRTYEVVEAADTR
jgi:HAMP domain-containing protein